MTLLDARLGAADDVLVGPDHQVHRENRGWAGCGAPVLATAESHSSLGHARARTRDLDPKRRWHFCAKCWPEGDLR